MTPDRWCVLVPQKKLDRAKGRLEVDPRERRALAVAMLRDTVAAAVATDVVSRVVVLWDDPADASALPWVDGLCTTGRDLNHSLLDGAESVRRDDPGSHIAVVPGDLPAVTAGDLARFLTEAAGHRRAFLPDEAGIGTTILTATAGTTLTPAYGGCSTLAHAASGAHLVDPTGLDSVRADVDDLRALGRALALGCGRYTLAACVDAGLVAATVS
jgi:2-phospho-L-lactate guanylyltransferase